ncbi:hypothetical protein JCM15764A_11880 [Geotalea toluenoxydans]
MNGVSLIYKKRYSISFKKVVNAGKRDERGNINVKHKFSNSEQVVITVKQIVRQSMSKSFVETPCDCNYCLNSQ